MDWCMAQAQWTGCNRKALSSKLSPTKEQKNTNALQRCQGHDWQKTKET
jgi:hypothetical protein